MLVISLVEEHVFTVTPLSGEVFEDAFFADAVFEAELLPELHADLIPTLANLESDDFPRHFSSAS